MKNILKKAACGALALAASLTASARDDNFYIYLCLGQSNMEGNAQIEPIDRTDVPERFKMMAAVDFSSPARTKGEWYTAVPPLVREYTGLTPMDYFGRTMVDNLPEEVTIGVVPVAIGGCKIEHLSKGYDPSQLASEADWFRNFMKAYDNAPYERMVECARKAREAGVIKGILLHQGESNTGDALWPEKVKKLYEDLLADLNLNAADVPLLAGEVVTSSKGGVCGSMNSIIDTLPATIPTSHVVSAANLDQKGDGLHFTPHAYRVLGCRYAVEMLATMGITDPKVEYSEEMPFVPKPEPAEGDFVFDMRYFNPSIWETGSFDPDTNTFIAGQYGFGGWEYDTPIDLSGYRYIVAELAEPESNGVEFRMFDTASYWEKPYAAKFDGKTLIVAELKGMMKNLDDGSIVPFNTGKVYRVGFWAYGFKPVKIKHVYATNVNPYDAAGVVAVTGYGSDLTGVCDLNGLPVAGELEKGVVYVSGGRKFILL